jgi:hypothetical protein
MLAALAGWVRNQSGRWPQGGKAMWIALFSITTAAAIALSVAAVMLQARQDVLRG